MKPADILVFAQNALQTVKTCTSFSSRLRIMPECKDTIMLIPKVWDNIKSAEWIKDCPLPKDEVFKRLKTLW